MLSLRRAAPVAVVTLLTMFALLLSTGGSSASDQGSQQATGRAGDQPDDSATWGLDPLFGDQDQPNIVVIMADDMRDDDLKYMPNTKRLIRDEGVRFKNTFSPQPLCCPARASFLSGMYSHNHKVWTHLEPYGFPVFRDEQTLPVWLEDVGYNTVFLGKYLNGYGGRELPDGSSSLHYVPPGWTDWRASVDSGIEPGPYNGGTYRYFDTTLNVNGVLEPNPRVYNTRVYGRHSIQAIEEYSRSPKPFFLWASYLAPHVGRPTESDDPPNVIRDDGVTVELPTPARPPAVRGRFDEVIKAAPGAAGERDVTDKPFFIRSLPPANAGERQSMLIKTRQRAESLFVMDQQVKRTIAALEATGELDNTIVALTSDNGQFLGEHRMRTGKILPYEPSLRVPLVMRGPGIPRGEVRTDPFTILDFAPTFLAAAGAQPQASVDGVSLLDVARNGDRGWTRGVLTETGPRDVKTAAARGLDLLDRESGPSVNRFSQGVRTPRYLYVEHASRERELYDLRADSAQNTNLVDRPGLQQTVRELARMLDRLRDCVGARCTVPLPATLQSR
jgi:arylsulfatase A-like enzyme